MNDNIDDEALISRLITAPDGIDYLITIKNWNWYFLDCMIEEGDAELDDMMSRAWKCARKMEEAGTMSNPGNFKAEFQDAIRFLIWETMQHLLAKEQGHTNSNEKPR